MKNLFWVITFLIVGYYGAAQGISTARLIRLADDPIAADQAYLYNQGWMFVAVDTSTDRLTRMPLSVTRYGYGVDRSDKAVNAGAWLCLYQIDLGSSLMPAVDKVTYQTTDEAQYKACLSETSSPLYRDQDLQVQGPVTTLSYRFGDDKVSFVQIDASVNGYETYHIAVEHKFYTKYVVIDNAPSTAPPPRQRR